MMNFMNDSSSSLEDSDIEGLCENINYLQSYCYSYDTSRPTRLHLCARNGNVNVATFLLENGCQIDAQDSMGNTALMIAIEKTNSEVIEVLLTAGADVFHTNCARKTVLDTLRSNYEIPTSTYKLFFREFRKRCSTSKEAAKRLIRARIELHLAVFTSDSKVIEYMLRRGIGVRSIHPVRQFTALHMAVYNSDLDIVDLLMRRGADARALDERNSSPLYYLYESEKTQDYKKVAILKFLLYYGVSPMHCGTEGYFEARYTLIEGDRHVISAILQSGMLDFRIGDELNDRTVLHYLAQNGNPGIVDELELHVDRGYDVNAIDRVGMTPLHWAAYYGNAEMLKYLLSKGANVDAEVYPQPPLYYAYTQSIPHYRKGCDRCVAILLENGADPQFVIFEPEDDRLITIFDAAEKTSGFEGLKPTIAQLALMEKSGVELTDITKSEIGTNAEFDEYFVECRKVISEEIFGSVTLYKLLEIEQKRIERLLRNRIFLRKMKQFNKRHKMRTRHSYLYNRWLKRYMKGKRFNRLKDDAARTVSKILGGCFGEDHLVVDKVMEYLDVQSWEYLARLREIL